MDNVTLPRLPFFTSGRSRAAACRPWLEKLQLKCTGPAQAIARLSGGNQQKAALARLLYCQCDVLLLDEPTRGIDVGAKARIYAVIDELAQAGRAVLIVSSYLPELLGLCDRIAVMCRGSLGEARPAAELDERKIMTEAVGGEVAAPSI
jgi:ribose transport system ATP-binding protein